jgi:hypothetical protein
MILSHLSLNCSVKLYFHTYGMLYPVTRVDMARMHKLIERQTRNGPTALSPAGDTRHHWIQASALLQERRLRSATQLKCHVTVGVRKSHTKNDCTITDK